jgi:hypothetical protein
MQRRGKYSPTTIWGRCVFSVVRAEGLSWRHLGCLLCLEGINISLDRKLNDCGFLENQFTSHDLCDENHEWWVEIRVEALLASVEVTPLGKVRPCEVHKLVNSLKLRKVCGLDDIPNECLRHLPRRPLVHLTHLFNHCFLAAQFSKILERSKIYNVTEPP